MHLAQVQFKGTECPQSLSQNGKTYFVFVSNVLFLNPSRSRLSRLGLAIVLLTT